MGKQYVIYDERAILQGTEAANVLEACGSLREVRRSDFDGKRGPLGVVYEYDVVPVVGEKYPQATNERYIGTVKELRPPR